MKHYWIFALRGANDDIIVQMCARCKVIWWPNSGMPKNCKGDK